MKKKDDILMEEEPEEESQVAASMDEEDEDSEPEKPRKPKTVLVPKVQNMDDYLMKHYKDYIIQELNKRLVDGELAEIVGVPVKSEHIIPGECCFRRFSYWRLNQCDFLIDIDLRVELRVSSPVITFMGFLTVEFLAIIFSSSVFTEIVFCIAHGRALVADRHERGFALRFLDETGRILFSALSVSISS